MQLRERDLPTRELLTLAQDVRAVTEVSAVPLMINDRIDLVLALNLAGVHLRANSLPVSVTRRALGPGRIIGVSAHAVDEAARAGDEGADYVVFGPIFDTPSKRAFGSPLGLERLADACRRTRVPVLAIGGITSGRVREIRDAGAHGVAVVGAILTRDDVGTATRELCDAVRA